RSQPTEAATVPRTLDQRHPEPENGAPDRAEMTRPRAKRRISRFDSVSILRSFAVCATQDDVRLQTKLLHAGTDFAREVIAHGHSNSELTARQPHRYVVFEYTADRLRILIGRQRDVLDAMMKADVVTAFVEDR